MDEHMLTTYDNPFNPFTNFDEWNAYDTRLGYNTLSYLARLTNSSHDLSDADQSLEMELAIDSIINLDPLGIYKKVSGPSPNEYEDPALSMITEN